MVIVRCIEMDIGQIIFFASPNDGSIGSHCKACLEIDTVPLPSNVRYYKPAAIYFVENFTHYLVVMFLCVNSESLEATTTASLFYCSIRSGHFGSKGHSDERLERTHPSL